MFSPTTLKSDSLLLLVIFIFFFREVDIGYCYQFQETNIKNLCEYSGIQGPVDLMVTS